MLQNQSRECPNVTKGVMYIAKVLLVSKELQGQWPQS
jgi:hypothetical protein